MLSRVLGLQLWTDGFRRGSGKPQQVWTSKCVCPRAALRRGTIFVMNDTTNLYFGIRFARSRVDPGNSAEIDLDKDSSGSISAGDDTLLINPDIGFFDEVWTTNAPCPSGVLCGFLDTDVGGQSNGDRKSTRLNSSHEW